MTEAVLNMGGRDPREVDQLVKAGFLDRLLGHEIKAWLWGHWDSLPASLKQRREERNPRTGLVQIFDVPRYDLPVAKIKAELSKAGIIRGEGGL